MIWGSLGFAAVKSRGAAIELPVANSVSCKSQRLGQGSPTESNPEAHRNYCASVLLVDPDEYGGGRYNGLR